MTTSIDVPEALVRDVDLLCLDAGNTVIFLDHARLAGIAREAGLSVDVDVLVNAEGVAKRLAETGELDDFPWSERSRPGALAWGKMVGTIARQAGLAAAAVPGLLERAWRAHEQRNLWCRVPAGLGEALDAVRATGTKVAIVSNSEGMLARLFEELGIAAHFDLVVDSAKVGVEKPDPRIFEIALTHFGVPSARAVHLGDVFATDILGARAAGIRHGLIDPFGHYTERHADVLRVPGAGPVAWEIARRRRASGRP